MGTKTKIEWAHDTFNPWMGCTKVSPACDHCYAETLATTRLGVQWGPNAERRRTAPSTWRQPLAWNRKAEKEGQRRRVFCASLADVFDNAVPQEWREDLWRLVDATPHLDWLLLTKRPQLIMNRLPIDWKGGRPNVWLGTTVENQAEADRRIPHLLAVPAAKRFLSCEPLLGPVDLSALPLPAPWPRCDCEGHSPRFDVLAGEIMCTGCCEGPEAVDCRIDWIIAGGESGPKARPSHPDWFRSLRDQCQAAGVPFFFKQWGEWHTSAVNMGTGQSVFRAFSDYQHWVNKASTWVRGGICLDADGRELKIGADFMRARDEERFPVTIMHRIGKKAAGASLDGREWREVPA
jgi:protein gp37